MAYLKFIAFAIEAENDALTEVPRSELYCRFCQINGHREKQCRRKQNDDSDIGRLASAIRSLGMNNRSNFGNNRRNFGNMNRNFGNTNRFNSNFNPNFNRNNFNSNWNQNRNNDNNFPNRNWNNNPLNRNTNQGQNQNNQNQNNNFLQNRNNFQQNSRQQQQRTNNVVRRARINTIQTDPEINMHDEEFNLNRRKTERDEM